MKENLKPIEIANKIIQESGINVFENNRRKYNVEMRSLLCFLLREKLNMRWLNIAKFFNDNNKSMTHASCIHAFKNYKMYKKTNFKLLDIENLFSFKSNLSIDEIDRVHFLENKCKLLEKKNDSDLVKLVKEIPEEKETEALNMISLMLKGWEWKK
tara:strand:- start:710 stop:1177 length:468 start_codon:yes stop_codon:yes gene_type:complete